MSIGFGHDNQEIDPADVVRTHLSHVSMIKELDAQRHKDLERISQLQKQIVSSCSVVLACAPWFVEYCLHSFTTI